MSDDRGYTLIELVVSLAIGMFILIAAFNLIDSATNATGRVTSHVDADQRGRPVMQRIVDELQSSCVVKDIPPIFAGSDGNSITFLSQSGSAVAILPDKHVISLAAGSLTDTKYPATGGSASTGWTFSATGTTRTLLTNVGAARIGSPPANAPLFQYFAYVNNAATGYNVLSTTPLGTPLTASTAGTTAQVVVSFSNASPGSSTRDANRSVTLSDVVTLRLNTVTDTPPSPAPNFVPVTTCG